MFVFIFTVKKEVHQMDAKLEKNKPESLCSETKALVTFPALFNSQCVYCTLTLKVLSSEMDPPEIMFISKGLHKKERRAGFLENLPIPDPVRAL